MPKQYKTFIKHFEELLTQPHSFAMLFKDIEVKRRRKIMNYKKTKNMERPPGYDCLACKNITPPPYKTINIWYCEMANRCFFAENPEHKILRQEQASQCLYYEFDGQSEKGKRLYKLKNRMSRYV